MIRARPGGEVLDLGNQMYEFQTRQLSDAQ